MEVFCHRLQQEHDCRIRVGTPAVRYLEKLRKQKSRLINEAKGFGAEARIRVDAETNSEGDANSIVFSCDIQPTEEEVLRDCFSLFCSQGVCGQGEMAGMTVDIRELTGSVRPLPPPLLAKVFSDCLKLNLNPPDFEILDRKSTRLNSSH